jgi:sRNA-binding regulator protein Hfq
MSEEQKVEPSPSTPPKKFKREHKGKFFRDMVGEIVLDHENFVMLLLTGEPFTGEIHKLWSYAFKLKDGKMLEKRDCLGAFPKNFSELILSREKPKHEVAYHRKDRINAEKIEALDQSLKGGRLHITLVNGWEIEGDVKEIAKFYVHLQVKPEEAVCLYRHAITDYQILREGDGSVLPRPKLPPSEPKPKKEKLASPQPAPTGPKIDYSKPEWWAILSGEPRRQNVNAKIKIVLREIPAEAREMGDIVWIPMQNQPKDLPSGLTLAPSPLDLVVTTKSWKIALKKGAEVKANTGLPPIYIVEALIGIQQGRLAAVATGIQIAESKPKGS